jgi:hypothetical protein
VTGILTLTVMMDHVGMMAPSGRLVRVRDGWAAVIHLTREDLTDDAAERSIGDIADLLEFRTQQVLAQVALIGPNGTGGSGRELRR